jgi:hypothetical protein
MNGSRRRTSAMLVVALCGATTQAQACGELMLRSLGAMRFRAFATKNPATILLYSGDAADKRPAATDTKLHDALERVGHKVTFARGHAELGEALAGKRYDVLIAYADDIARAFDQMAKAGHEPALIPVLDATAANEREMRERYPRLVTGSFKDLLKAIERAMTAAKA